MNGEPNSRRHPSLAASIGPFETCSNIRSWISTRRSCKTVRGEGGGRSVWRRRPTAESEGGVRPFMKIVGAVYERLPAAST